MRHTAGRLIGEVAPRRVLCVGPGNPLLQEFETAAQFHESRAGYLANLYEPTTAEDPFSEVIKFNNIKLLVSAPVTIGKQCKRVPFLIDTSCGTTIVHQITFDKFLKPDQAVPREVRIGRHPLATVVHSRFTTERTFRHNQATGATEAVEIPHLLGYLNLLGMDFLNAAVPDLHRYLHANLSRYQPPLDTVMVTNGTMAFGVKPDMPVAWALKKAIKEYMQHGMAAIDAPLLTIKDQSGRTLADKDPLHAGVKYSFELPFGTV
jgi:hypothetical protein